MPGAFGLGRCAVTRKSSAAFNERIIANALIENSGTGNLRVPSVYRQYGSATSEKTGTIIRMETSAILAAIDEEIERLQQVRELLVGGDGTRRGRPLARSFPFGDNKPRKKRFLSAEARAKIAAAQRKRWAKQKAAK